MKQKDYKKIAEIIKSEKCISISKAKPLANRIAKSLAYYFEEEEKEFSEQLRKKGIHNHRSAFNKKQFLKDCGVEE